MEYTGELYWHLALQLWCHKKGIHSEILISNYNIIACNPILRSLQVRREQSSVQWSRNCMILVMPCIYTTQIFCSAKWCEWALNPARWHVYVAYVSGPMITNSEEFYLCGGSSECENSCRAGLCLPDRKRVKNRHNAKPRSVLQELDAEGLQLVTTLLN